MSLMIRCAALGDIAYVDMLQRRNAEQLSFYPRAVFEREIRLGRIVVAELNGEPCGYLYHGALAPICRVHQACIQYDARGRLHGAALVGWLQKLCAVAGSLSITLRCGSDIEANGFWQAVGFHCEAVSEGGIRRRRQINHWRLDVQPALFVRAVAPSNRAQDASIWRRRAVFAPNQFIRGAALRAYRQLVEVA